MGISVSSFVKRISDGRLHGKPDSSLPLDSLGSPNFLVLFEHPPKETQLVYYLNRLDPAETLSIDLIAHKEIFGELWLSQFLDVSSLITEAAHILKEYRSHKKSHNN